MDTHSEEDMNQRPGTGPAVGAKVVDTAAPASPEVPQPPLTRPHVTDATDAHAAPRGGVAADAPQAALALRHTLSQDQVWRQSRLAMMCWRAIALVFMALGLMGVVLPVMPHVPFFLVALWAAGKGWPALERWLLDHPQFGPQLRNWKDHRAISLPVKCISTLTMAFSAVGMQLFGDLPLWLRIGVPCTMLVGAIYIWTRPTQ